MSTETELFKEGRHDELWQRCCSFIDLSIDDFMRIQNRLLMEQLELLRKCELGRYILNGTTPSNQQELRSNIPLTTYEDYAPYLLDKREDALPDKPALWQYTSGKSGEYPFRWAPVTNTQLREIKSLLLALVFFSGCTTGPGPAPSDAAKPGASTAPAAKVAGLSASKSSERGKAAVVMAARGPVIDGTFSDPAWQSATVLRLGEVTATGLGKHATTARLLIDDRSLYVGFECAEPNTDAMRRDVTTRDDAVWNDDVVEV